MFVPSYRPSSLSFPTLASKDRMETEETVWRDDLTVNHFLAFLPEVILTPHVIPAGMEGTVRRQGGEQGRTNEGIRRVLSRQGGSYHQVHGIFFHLLGVLGSNCYCHSFRSLGTVSTLLFSWLETVPSLKIDRKDRKSSDSACHGFRRWD